MHLKILFYEKRKRYPFPFLFSLFLITPLLLNCKSRDSSEENKLNPTKTSNMILQNTEEKAKTSFLKSVAYTQAKDKMGEYDSLEYFILGELMHEFRVGLLNIYKEEDLRKSIKMMEVTWSIGLFDNLTIWYEQTNETTWKEIDRFEWKKGSEF
jgi:hypothetical protein